MSRSVDDLDPTFQPRAFELVARCTGRGVPLMIVDTLRTPEEQRANLARGVSKTQHSLHLPQPPLGKAKAMDVCPYSIFQLHGPDKLQYDTRDPAWTIVREEAKRLGLRWGGDWRRPNEPDYLELRDPRTVNPYDPGHVEIA